MINKLCSNNEKIDSLIDTISSKYSQTSNLTIKVVNLATNTEYKPVNNAKNKKSYYVIIYDPTHKHSIYIGDCYYCNCLEDLESIILYMLNNEDIYVATNSNDVMDQSDLVYIDDQKNYKLLNTLVIEEE